MDAKTTDRAFILENRHRLSKVKAHFALPRLAGVVQPDGVEVEIRTRDGVITSAGETAAAPMVAGLPPEKKLFHLNVRQRPDF